MFAINRRGVLAATALTLLVAVGAYAAMSDPWITTKAKIALFTAEGIHGSEINVDTVNGQVTLHGKVESAAEKTKAETVVRDIEGVTNVRNLLQVVSTKQGTKSRHRTKRSGRTSSRRSTSTRR
jgi:hypothetical protein